MPALPAWRIYSNIILIVLSTNRMDAVRLGAQVMLLVASETGHVYTFATPQLQPMVTADTGKALIQTCLSSAFPIAQSAPGNESTATTQEDSEGPSYSIAIQPISELDVSNFHATSDASACSASARS